MIAANISGTNVYGLIVTRARQRPNAPALTSGDERLSYAEVIERADAIAVDLSGRGVDRGDRVAILSENRLEYTLVQIACAKLGAIVACLNWRLTVLESTYCVGLVDPVVFIASRRYFERAELIGKKVGAGLVPLSIEHLGAVGEVACTAQPEDCLLIIYTSGTTGLPKAAMISHRAEIARMSALRLDLRIDGDDGYVAWAPMFHMGGTEHLLATLMSGGHGTIVDGFDVDAICDAIEREKIGWLMLVPATILPLAERLEERAIVPVGIKAVGCMADLVPSAEVARITSLLRAPYLNSFGATETGMPPLSGHMIAAGETPDILDKQISSLTELRLSAFDGGDVSDGNVGELWVRGPTLFSGYWATPEVNVDCFQDGWFRMGDLFRRTERGYAFVGRSKYLIKSGGENIYPAEIERVLLADARIADAVVVRRADTLWGEVPVAVVARADASLSARDVDEMCREAIASYKCPRDVVFVQLDQLPRSASGKIVREDVERLVQS